MTASTHVQQTRSVAAEQVGRFIREQWPSVLVGGVAVVYFAVVCARLPWGEDLALHLAVLDRLTAHPLHPGNPVLSIGGSSAYYTPYTVLLALIGRATGAAALSLYRVAALVNVLLLLSGMYRYVRTLSPARWAPPLALIGLFFWWGTSVIAWSGFLSLASCAVTLAYPSTLATALTLHLWASLARLPLTVRRTALLGLWLGAIVLIHQFTALGTIIGVLALLTARRRDLGTRALVLRCLGAGCAACLALVAAWPYYHLWDLGQGQLSQLDSQHFALYNHAVYWYGLAAFGLAALALRWWRAKTDQLDLLFLGAAAVVAYGAISGHWSLGRSWPMAMLAAQVALAVAAAEARGRWARIAWAVPVAAVTAVGVWSQSSAVLYALPPSLQASASADVAGHWPGALPTLDWLGAWLKPGDVVMANQRVPQDEIAAHDAYGVASPWILPEFPAGLYDARARIVVRFFAPGTSAADRAAVLGTYHVTWILLGPGEPLPGGVPAVLTASGGGFELYRVGAGS